MEISENNSNLPKTFADGMSDRAKLLPEPGECGTVSYSGGAIIMGFIVGGERTRIFEAPW